MVRGTTAQFQFKLPYSKYDVEVAEVSLWQPNNFNGLNEEYPLPIKKNYTQKLSESGSVITEGPWNWVDDYTLSIKVWELETLTFSDKLKAKIQLRGTANGVTFASAQELITVYPIYGDHPLNPDIPSEPDEDGYIILDGDDI